MPTAPDENLAVVQIHEPGLAFVTPHGTSYLFNPRLVVMGQRWPDWVEGSVGRMGWYDRAALKECIEPVYNALIAIEYPTEEKS